MEDTPWMDDSVTFAEQLVRRAHNRGAARLSDLDDLLEIIREFYDHATTDTTPANTDTTQAVTAREDVVPPLDTDFGKRWTPSELLGTYRLRPEVEWGAWEVYPKTIPRGETTLTSWWLRNLDAKLTTTPEPEYADIYIGSENIQATLFGAEIMIRAYAGQKKTP